MTSPKSIVLLGDGRMAAQCARIVSNNSGTELAGVVTHELAQGWTSSITKALRGTECALHCCENVNDSHCVDFVAAASPDIIFNVNSLDIIHAELLSIPPDGIINFHNGPVPGYRGMNIPSWAIINRETEHGVTWHYVIKKIDSGNIVASSTFALDQDETAISLNFKCIEAGLALFGPLLEDYLSGALAGIPQSGPSKYYWKSLVPDSLQIDFQKSFGELDALVRGLTFHPFPNEFATPKVKIGNEMLVVGELRLVRKRHPDEKWIPGQILEISEDGVLVCVKDAVVRLSSLLDENDHVVPIKEMSERCGLLAGQAITLSAANGL